MNVITIEAQCPVCGAEPLDQCRENGAVAPIHVQRVMDISFPDHPPEPEVTVPENPDPQPLPPTPQPPPPGNPNTPPIMDNS